MATDTQEERHTVDTPLSKEEYLEKSNKPLPGYTRTIDANDVGVGTTVNGADGPGVTVADGGAPGQVFETWQLPDPQIAVDAGFPPVAVPEHLIVDGEYADGQHPQGADGLDLINRDLRQHLGNPRLDGAGRILADEVAGFTEDDYDEADDEARGERDETGSGQPVGEGNQSSRQRSEQGDGPAGGSPEGQGTPENTAADAAGKKATAGRKAGDKS